MRNHGNKEHGIKPRERALKPRDQPPVERKVDVARVMHLARQPVPAIGQDLVAQPRLNGARVLERLPRDLGERVAQAEGAALGGAEAVLLAVAAVPDPVDEEVAGEEGGEDGRVVAVRVGVVLGEVEGAVAVRERDAGEVPEDEHEAPLLVVHVPGGDNELLALGARVGVEVVRHEQEADLARDVAVGFVLAHGGAGREEEQDVPREADLEEHFKVEDAKHARVELGAHEEVVDVVARHAVRGAARKGRGVGDDADDVAREDGDREERAELVDDGRQAEEAGEVQRRHDGDGGVEGGVGRAVVRELLAAHEGQGLAVGPDAGHQAIARALKDEEGPVHGPGFGVGKGARVDEVDEVEAELLEALVGRGRGEAPVVVLGTDPHVPHEHGEADHHEAHERGTKELVLARVVDLGVHAGPPAVDELLLGVPIGSLCISIDVVLCVAVGGGEPAPASHLLFGRGGRRRPVLFLLVEMLDELGGPALPKRRLLRDGRGLGGRAGLAVGLEGELLAAGRCSPDRRLYHAIKKLLLSAARLAEGLAWRRAGSA